MKRIDRMPHDLDIINHTALSNHNECVDKINEIIDVLNARERPKEQTTLQEQKQILESLSELCKNHKKYTCGMLDNYQGINTELIPEVYISLCNATRKAIIRILNRFKLPLLDTYPYSFLKRNIEYIIGEKNNESRKVSKQLLNRILSYLNNEEVGRGDELAGMLKQEIKNEFGITNKREE